jgi:hypothetical protein
MTTVSILSVILSYMSCPKNGTASSVAMPNVEHLGKAAHSYIELLISNLATCANPFPVQ